MIYATLMRAAGPLLRRHVQARIARDKEIPGRTAERFGIAGLPRPPGPLLWFHAASVGEATALLGLIGAVLDRFPQSHALLTTGTVSSQRLIAPRLPDRAVHQFAPLDHPDWVSAFLDHWKPDLAIWTESELWPNWLAGIGRRRIPAAMVNSRMSPASARNWRFLKPMLRHLLGVFSLRLAQSEGDAERFAAFGVPFECIGNIKAAVQPVPLDSSAKDALTAAIAGRPVWLAASTHAPEEDLALQVHAALAPRFPGLLTMIVPRHPDRVAEIVAQAQAHGLTLARRSMQAVPDRDTQIYLADTMGEMPVFYAASPITFVGGSFGAGGHSPIEAAQQGTAIVYGPDRRNNGSLVELLQEAGGLVPVNDAGEMTQTVGDWLANPAVAQQIAIAGQQAVARQSGIVGRVMDRLAPLFAAAGMG